MTIKDYIFQAKSLFKAIIKQVDIAGKGLAPANYDLELGQYKINIIEAEAWDEINE